jgi:hypothetical protein
MTVMVLCLRFGKTPATLRLVKAAAFGPSHVAIAQQLLHNAVDIIREVWPTDTGASKVLETGFNAWAGFLLACSPPLPSFTGRVGGLRGGDPPPSMVIACCSNISDIFYSIRFQRIDPPWYSVPA